MDSDTFTESGASLELFARLGLLAGSGDIYRERAGGVSLRALFNSEGCQTGHSRSDCYESLIALGINGRLIRGSGGCEKACRGEASQNVADCRMGQTSHTVEQRLNFNVISLPGRAWREVK